MLFIVVHQVYELWFKEILHELDYLRSLLQERKTPAALHTLKRILTIMKVLVAQLDILETMTPLEFYSFRDRLESGSGLQSFQFRELLFTLGSRNPESVAHYPEGSVGREHLQRRFTEPSLWDAFLHYLSGNGYNIPQEQLERDVTKSIEPSRPVQEILIEVYRNDPEASSVCERLVDLDEGLQEWRYRHVKMVQRTIGHKIGTGGTSGAAYLMTTLFKPIFPDLWEIRAEL
jgi:tryptophan 2,3-dioxygenase